MMNGLNPISLRETQSLRQKERKLGEMETKASEVKLVYLSSLQGGTLADSRRARLC